MPAWLLHSFTQLSGWYLIYPLRAIREFQSPPGWRGHSDESICGSTSVSSARFNPDRAGEVIPTSFAYFGIHASQLVSIPTGQERPFRHEIHRLAQVEME
jgi:hypothetical protein